MRLPDWLFLKATRFPELVGVEAEASKRAIRACRWKLFGHWQVWVAFIFIIFFGTVLTGLGGIAIINFKVRIFSQFLMSLVGLLALALYLCLLYVARKTSQYYLAPHIISFLTAESADSELQAEHDRLQQLRKRAIKRGSWLLAPCLLSIIVIVALAAQNPGGSAVPLQVPEALKAPRVVTNTARMTKKVFLEDARLGHVTDIIFRLDSSGPGGKIILAGTKGALFAGADLTTNFITFDSKRDHVDFIRLDSRGNYGFINRGAWCNNAQVMDKEGHTLWSYSGRETGIDDMSSGDLDGDGNPEYVVGFNGGGGVHLLDGSGRKIWGFPDGNVWHTEITDIDGDGRNEIVHSNAGGAITVRDRHGKVVSKSKPEPYFSDFSLVRWPKADGPVRLLLAENDAIWIFDASAKIHAKFPAPNAGTLGDARGTLLALPNGKQVLATVTDFENWNRSILYIHTISGELLYQEILPESCRSVAILPADATQPESLMIGCEGKIIEYRINDA